MCSVTSSWHFSYELSAYQLPRSYYSRKVWKYSMFPFLLLSWTDPLNINIKSESTFHKKNTKQHVVTSVTLHHVPVGVVCDWVDVRRHLVTFLALVHINDLFWVDWQHLVGVHHHTEQTWVSLEGEREQMSMISPVCGRHIISICILLLCIILFIYFNSPPTIYNNSQDKLVPGSDSLLKRFTASLISHFLYITYLFWLILKIMLLLIMTPWTPLIVYSMNKPDITAGDNCESIKSLSFRWPEFHVCCDVHRDN